MSADPSGYVDRTVVSNCCGAPSIGEVINGEGICFDCKEHASFEAEPEPKPETLAEYEQRTREYDAEQKIADREER